MNVLIKTHQKILDYYHSEVFDNTNINISAYFSCPLNWVFYLNYFFVLVSYNPNPINEFVVAMLMTSVFNLGFFLLLNIYFSSKSFFYKQHRKNCFDNTLIYMFSNITDFSISAAKGIYLTIIVLTILLILFKNQNYYFTKLWITGIMFGSYLISLGFIHLSLQSYGRRWSKYKNENQAILLE